MHVELIPEQTYTVRANGREIPGMKFVSTWEGMRKLQDAQGRVLLLAAAAGPLTSCMQRAFGDIFEGAGERAVAVAGSPDLLAILMPEPDSEIKIAGRLDEQATALRRQIDELQRLAEVQQAQLDRARVSYDDVTARMREINSRPGSPGDGERT